MVADGDRFTVLVMGWPGTFVNSNACEEKSVSPVNRHKGWCIMTIILWCWSRGRSSIVTSLSQEVSIANDAMLTVVMVKIAVVGIAMITV